LTTYIASMFIMAIDLLLCIEGTGLGDLVLLFEGSGIGYLGIDRLVFVAFGSGPAQRTSGLRVGWDGFSLRAC